MADMDDGDQSTPDDGDVAEPSSKRRFPTGFVTIRDLLTFTAGMAIIVNEVFFSNMVEAAAMATGIALAGLPVVFSADERNKKRG